MNRRVLPLVALVTLLGACSSSGATSNRPGPGEATASRGEMDGRRGGRGERRGGGQGQGQREDMVLRGITLSADQQQRIQGIRASYRTQIQEAREQEGRGGAARERVQELMEKQRTEIRAVLTSDQQAQYDRNIEEMRDRMRGQRRPGSGR